MALCVDARSLLLLLLLLSITRFVSSSALLGWSSLWIIGVSMLSGCAFIMNHEHASIQEGGE